MPDRTRKASSEDENEIAARILAQATDEEPDDELRRQAAKILGRLGGKKGGPARAKKLSKRRLSEIARKAAQARWENKKTES